MSDHPTKEELSAAVPERLNKEEMYAKYGPYVSKEVYNQWKGKATKTPPKLEQTIFPGVPDELQDELMVASLKSTPEKNAQRLALLDQAEAMGFPMAQYTPTNLEARNAAMVMGGVAAQNLVGQNRINHLRLSRKAAASLIEYNLQNDPAEYAKFAEARENIGRAARYYGAPEEVIQLASTNYAYNAYLNELNDGKYGHVSLAYISSPIGKAATPQDLRIMRQLAASQDERIREITTGGFDFTRAYRMKQDLLARLSQIDKGELNSQAIKELNELSEIYKQYLSDMGFFDESLAGIYEWAAYIPQDLGSVLNEDNYGYVSNTQQFLTERMDDPYVDVVRLQQGLGGVKLFETINLERNRRDNLSAYLAIAANTGKSFDQVVKENKDNFDLQLSLKAAASMATLLAGKGGELGRALVLPAIEKMAVSKATKALMLTGTELGSDAVINAAATAPLEGGISAAEYQLATANNLPTEYKSLAAAYMWGMTNNLIENLAGGAVFGSPWVARDIFNWYKDYKDVARVEKTIKEAELEQGISTMETAPEATKKSILKAQGYVEKNLYFYPEDLRLLREDEDVDLSVLTDEQRNLMFAQVDSPVEGSPMVVISREDFGRLFKDSPLAETFAKLAHDRATARNAAERDDADDSRVANLDRVLEENPELATTTKEEREAIKHAAAHELQEQMVSMAYNEMAAAGYAKIATSDITTLSREFAGINMALIDQFNLPTNEAIEFFRSHMPKFGVRKTVLDIESGRAKDKTQGTYDAQTHTVDINKDADVLTLFHEMTHHYLEMAMTLADEFTDNKYLQKMKENVFKGYFEDPDIQNRKWADIDPEIKERMQETFARDYIKMRVERAFSPDNYVAANKLDKEGHKTGRKFVALAGFDRTLAEAWANKYGRTLKSEKGKKKLTDEQKRAEVHATFPTEQAAFEADYGITDYPDMREVAAMFNNAAKTYTDEHLINNLWPLGETDPNIPDLPPKVQKQVQRTYELITDEHHVMLSAALSTATQQELRNMDKIYEMRKKDIENNPEYKEAQAQSKAAQKQLEADKDALANIDGTIKEQNNQLKELYAERTAINSKEYRAERGALKRGVTNLTKKAGKNTQQLATALDKYLANEELLKEVRVTKELTRQAYEQAKSVADNQRQIMMDAQALLDQRKGELDAMVKGGAGKEDLALKRRYVKNQNDTVRRATKRYNELAALEKKALADFEKSSNTETKLIAQNQELDARMAELQISNVEMGREIQNKQAQLDVDLVADINAKIDTLKATIKDTKVKRTEAKAKLDQTKKTVADLKKRMAEAKANYAKELAENDELFGTAAQRRQAFHKMAEADLDNPETLLGKKYQDAKLYKEMLDSAPEDSGVLAEVMGFYKIYDADQLKEFLEHNTNRAALIEEYGDAYFARQQGMMVTQERIDQINMNTMGKTFKVLLDAIEGRISTQAREARKLFRYQVKSYRKDAGKMRYSNTSPQMLMTRAKAAYARCQRIPTMTKKYKGNFDQMLADMYRELLSAEYYIELAQAGVRMKNDVRRQLNQITRKLNASGVNDRIPSEYQAAARALLARIGVVKGSTPTVILNQIRDNFPEQWNNIKGFFEDVDKRGVSHYSQMQLGDLQDMIDTIDVILHNGELIQKERLVAQQTDRRLGGDKIRNGSMEQWFKDHPDKAAERAATDAVNKPDDRQLTGLAKFWSLRNKMRNDTLTVQTAAEMIDGSDHGEFKRRVYDDVANGNAAYILKERELAEKMKPMLPKIRELFNPKSKESVDLKLNEPLTWRDKDGNPVPIVPSPNGNIREALVGILIHFGNDSNFDALCRSLNMDGDDLVKYIRDLEHKGVINADLMDYVQMYWDAFEPVGVAALKAYNEINGGDYELIKGREINICGKTYRGGYAPLTRKREQLLNRDVTLQEQLADAAQDLPPAMRPGFAKERNEGSTMKLDLSHDGIMNALSRQMRYAYIFPALNRVNLFVKANPEMMRDIEIRFPGFSDEVLAPWMRAVGNGSSNDIRINDTTRALGNAGARINQSIMAGNVSNAAQQITGLIVATAKVGPGALLKAMFKRMPRDQIFELSPYMRTRLEDNKPTLSSIRRDLHAHSKVSRGKNYLDDHSYILQTTTQNWIDSVVWSAKYQEQLGKGMQPGDAAAAADQAIRMTQGSFNIVDSSAFDRNPISKILIPFMNYFQAMANLWRARLEQMNLGVDSRIHRAFNGILLGVQIMVIPSLVGFAIAQTIKGFWADADEDDAWQFMEDATASAATGVLSGIHPFAAQAATIAYNLYQDKPTPSSIINAPIATLIPSAIRSSTKIYDAVVNGDDLSSYDVVNVLHVFNAMGFFPAWGSAAATRGFAIGAMATGSADTDSAVDAVRAAVTGTLSDAQKGNR